MNTPLLLSLHTAHVWLAELSEFESDVKTLLALLSADEVKRAMRFRSSLHQNRFIISRGLLRKTLSLYTGILPQDLVFELGPHGKPYLHSNPFSLQFNVSHSADLAVFAMTAQQEIGVDVEKVESRIRDDVAKRFLNAEEYQELMLLAGDVRVKKFYQLWCKKEALIKMVGEGLFSQKVSQKMDAPHSYFIEELVMPEGYQAALATGSPIESIVYQRHMR